MLNGDGEIEPLVEDSATSEVDTESPPR